MGNVSVAIGLIAAVVIFSLIVAAYSPVFGSLHNDAEVANITNSSHNGTYQTGVEVAQGFMGLDITFVYAIFILLIIVVFLLIFVL